MLLKVVWYYPALLTNAGWFMHILLSCFGVLQRVLTHKAQKLFTSCDRFLSIVVGWTSCTKTIDIPLSVIIAYNVYKVVGHWIMFESQCVDYMALTRMSIVEAPQQLFKINLIQFHSGTWLTVLEWISLIYQSMSHAWDAVQCLVSSVIYTRPVNLQNVSGKDLQS